jgi:ferredoxin
VSTRTVAVAVTVGVAVVFPVPSPSSCYDRGVSASRFRSLSYLAYRAVVAHPLKRLVQRGTGLERFLANYAGEGLVPTRPQDRELGEEASACIACGLCEPACDLASAVPALRAMGLHAAFRLYGKSSAELPFARAALEACSACAACENVCPSGVPIARVVRGLLARVASGAR